jgi:TolB protein
LLLVLVAILAFVLLRQDGGVVSVTPTPGPASAQGRISFVRGNEDLTRDIYVVDPDGSRMERVTRGIYVEGLTAWSPDGRYIVAQVAQEGISTIARVSVAPDNKGGEVVALTSDMLVDATTTKADSALPSWSPDGAQIAFQSKKEGGNFQVYVMDRDGNNKRRISTGQTFAAQPAWSHDGRSIAYIGGDKVDIGTPKEIYTVSVDGGRPKQITTGGKDLSKPTWSPDGKQILYLENLTDKTGNIMIMNADGTGGRKLADGIRASNPQFNPAGDMVLYYYISLSPPTGSDIFTVPTAGGEPTNLTPNTPEDYQPAWSPDGKMLTWSSVLGGIKGHKIVVSASDGSGVRVVGSGDGDDYQPQWGPAPKP